MDSVSIKSLFTDWQREFNNDNKQGFHQRLKKLAANATIHMCHPFGDINGADDFYHQVYSALFEAMPDVERRDMIILAATTPEGQHWLGSMGNYMGTFNAPLLEIPPTGQLAHMRYHEFYRFENNTIVEIQAIWDIPELMMQAKAWPMAPQLGTFLCTPAPIYCDGLTVQGDGQANRQHVIDMLTNLCNHPANPDPKVMQLPYYWHPKMNWYGPTGIGTARGMAGFRHWHQKPFLRAMPDRKLDAMGELMSHWIAEGNYVCETGWPNMRLTLNHDGWMGIAPTNKEVLLRSLDFWSIEMIDNQRRIRENWVLVDLLHLYYQLDVDVLARMQEFNKVRHLTPLHLEQDY